MRKPLVWFAAGALLMGTEAMAGMSYNYAQGSLIGSQLQSSGNSASGSGTWFEGGVEIEQELYGFVGFGADKYSENGGSTRFSNSSLGVGGHVPMSDNLDFVATVAGERVKLRISGFSSDTFGGWGVTAGLRGQPRKQIQWTAGIRYRSLERLKSVYGLTAGGRYYFNPGFALGLDLTAQQYDKNTLNATESIATLTFRFEFGTRY